MLPIKLSSGFILYFTPESMLVNSYDKCIVPLALLRNTAVRIRQTDHTVVETCSLYFSSFACLLINREKLIGYLGSIIERLEPKAVVEVSILAGGKK